MVCAHVHVCACTCMCAVCVSVLMEVAVLGMKGPDSCGLISGMWASCCHHHLWGWSPLKKQEAPRIHTWKSATMHCWHTAVSRMRKGVQGTETCVSWLPRKDPIGPRYNTEWVICPETILQWWRHSFYSAPHRVTCHMRLVTPEMWPLWPRTDFYILFHFKYLQ